MRSGADDERAGRGRPKDVDSAETRQRVLAAARQMFAANGYAATTNREIAATAGLTAAALYHYADSKAALYAAVYAEVQEEVYGAFDNAVARESTLAGRLCAVLDAAVALNRSDASISGFINVVPTDALRHPELREPVAGARGRAVGFVRALIEEAAAGGELAPEWSTRQVEDMFNAILGGLSRMATLMDDDDRHVDAVDAMKALIRGGLLS